MWTLIRLILRRDRIKLPVWIGAIAGLVALNTPALREFYGTPAETMNYAVNTASSMVTRLWGGAIEGPTFGAIVMVELYVFIALLIAFMSTLAIIRHTRQNEETGRSELLGSLVTGRHAALAAAMVVVVCANIVTAALIGAILLANDLPSDGAWLMAVSMGLIGITFAGLAAIGSQFTENARTANGIAAAAIGVAMLVRGIGDALGQVAADGLSVTSSWIVWLSPLGWGQQILPFSQQRIWPIALFVGVIIIAFGTAFALSAKRDVGLGILPARRGPARAKHALLSPLGLARRLQHGVFIGWLVGITAIGLTFGGVADEFQNFIEDNEQLAEVIQQLGGASGTVTDIFFSAIFGIVAIIISAYGLQALLRLRSEEASGHLESVLATATGRLRWMISHIILVFGGAVIITAVMAASTAILYVLLAGEGWSEVGRLVGASLIHLPAIFVLMSVAVAAFGLLPRIAVGLSWLAFTFCLFISQFGAALELPQWVLNITPFTHTPAAPAASIPLTPLFILLAVAIGFVAIGLTAFRRRNLTTSG